MTTTEFVSSGLPTSKHFQIKEHDLVGFLAQFGLPFKNNGDEVKLQYCPLCPKPHRNQSDNMWTLNIQKISGVFHCFRCNASGNWFDFKRNVIRILTGQDIVVDS